VFAGAGDGGRAGAAGGGRPIRARLRESEGRERAVEVRFSLPDPWSRRLFIAPAGATGCGPSLSRMHRQRRRVEVPPSFLDQCCGRSSRRSTPR